MRKESLYLNIRRRTIDEMRATYSTLAMKEEDFLN